MCKQDSLRIAASIAAGLLFTLTATAADDEFGFFFAFGPNCGCGSHVLGTSPDATMGYDERIEFTDPLVDLGFAGVYHDNKDTGWDGPTGYYRTDYRPSLAPQQPMTWAPLHLWANPDYEFQPEILLSMEPHPFYTPPSNRNYSLELLDVPPDIVGAPDIGTTWQIPADGRFELYLPGYESNDGAKAYQFAFHASSVVPEPASAVLFAIAALIRKRR